MSDEKSEDTPVVPFTTPEILALEAQIAVTRQQLASTVDEVVTRLDPRTQAAAAAAASRQMVHDALSEDAAPEDQARARKVLGGAVAGVVVLVALVVLRARRHD
ncbi:DUF3618 domain-containing protein [Cellulomonas sp. DKR-3]|uniref:DUF3618 domain-containing protein n=1 Tax=Cellulomonas fulva TaxID=2835530 RepID=A0ABS5TY84_9CELL|nr:DUF3618 domain-containing protein [Cellulomonas fulva]MBT0994072.1 DUF3618 domain-containing protein [Cellulomonas fulva]